MQLCRAASKRPSAWTSPFVRSETPGSRFACGPGESSTSSRAALGACASPSRYMTRAARPGGRCGAEACWNRGSGRAHNVALATLPGFTIPGDISSSRRYWEEDIVRPEFEMTDGLMPVPDGPGIGVEPRNLANRGAHDAHGGLRSVADRTVRFPSPRAGTRDNTSSAGPGGLRTRTRACAAARTWGSPRRRGGAARRSCRSSAPRRASRR